MLTLVPGQAPMVTPGNELHPPGLMRVPHFAIDADAFERLAAKYAQGDEVKNLAVHIVRSKCALDERLAELMPLQWAVHEQRLALEQATTALQKDREAQATFFVESAVANERREGELAAKERELATREAALEVQQVELLQRSREMGKEQTAFGKQAQQLAAERAKFERDAAPIRRKLAHLKQMEEIGGDVEVGDGDVSDRGGGGEG
jgi:hypothetical protein